MSSWVVYLYDILIYHILHSKRLSFQLVLSFIKQNFKSMEHLVFNIYYKVGVIKISTHVMIDHHWSAWSKHGCSEMSPHLYDSLQYHGCGHVVGQFVRLLSDSLSCWLINFKHYLGTLQNKIGIFITISHAEEIMFYYNSPYTLEFPIILVDQWKV